MMRLRSFLLIVLAVSAANPCFARNAHPQHGIHANSTTNGVRGTHPAGANPASANTPIDAEASIAPPVLPSHGTTQQQIRPNNLNGKTVGPGNPPHGQTGATTLTAPIARNAIGQPVVSPKNLAGSQPVAGLQRPGAVPPPVLHGATAAPLAVSSAAMRVNLATTINRGGEVGATVIRPLAGSSGIGGPAQAAYGINGTTVRNKR